MTKKYELVEVPNVEGVFRIRALKDFNGVKKGDIGGWVSEESNLSHKGDCWVYDNARVLGNARVCDNAIVEGNSSVQDYAIVYGNAKILGNATVNTNAKVYGNALIDQNARVIENAEVFDDACILGNATICGESLVYDEAVVGGYVWVSGKANICGDSRVHGDTIITGDALIKSSDDYIAIYPIGIGEHTVSAYKNKDGGILVHFEEIVGSTDEFKEYISDKYGDSPYKHQFDSIIDLIIKRFGV